MSGTGTAKSGFLTAEHGPFRCSNCTFWRSPVGCVQKDVVADPEVPKIQAPNGVVMGKAHTDDCCSYFTTLKSIIDKTLEEVGL